MTSRILSACRLAAAITVLTIGAPSAALAVNDAVYTYNVRGQITSATYDNGVIIYYFYDSDGNRISQTTKVNSADLDWTAAATPCSSNCWGGALWQ